MGLLRSLLFMPGNQEKMLLKTPTVTADAVIWDLEDAVAPADKAAARELVGKHIAGLPAGVPVFVRVNPFSTGMAEDDLFAAVHPRLSGVILPKTENPDELRLLSRLLGRLEAERGIPGGSLKVIALIESALGVIRAHEVATASDRVIAVALGAEDLTRDIGTSRTKEGTEVSHARGFVALAAAAAGVASIDTPHTDLNDLDALRAECLFVKQLGFSGKLAIHPKQVEVVNTAFAPTEAELAWARKVAAAVEAAGAAYRGVIAVDGKMVDKPVVDRALRILATGEAAGGKA